MLLLAAFALLMTLALLACAAGRIAERRREKGKLQEHMQLLHVARAGAVCVCAECGQTIDVGEVIVWLSRASGTSLGPSHARCMVVVIAPSGVRLRPGTGEIVSGAQAGIEVDEHLWQRWTAELGTS